MGAMYEHLYEYASLRAGTSVMKDRYVIGVFAHSIVSDWNHGNAHFLRGLVQSLMDKGHEVKCYEELGSWSMNNLVKSEGERAIDAIDIFRERYPQINVQFYSRDDDVDVIFRRAAERL